MKLQKITLLAALTAGVLFTLNATSNAQDNADKPNRPQRPAGTEQPGGGPGGRRAGQAGDMLKEMSEKLNLTAEQKAKLQEALKSQREALQGLRDLPPEERRTKMQENRKAMDAKLKEILTAEQYAKWEKIREELRPGGGNRPGGPGGPGGERPNRPNRPGKTN